ncbi:MAG: DUF58 domain-containing protein [Bacteroidia bacterium]|nr:DUF58 domain-containing protein [Bacteroidia bacterium]
MDARIKELLKPEILNQVDGLELIARIVVEGFMSGSNRSQSVGASQEFSQYRGYEPGDDLRQLDWKMYARSERYYIKQAEIETNITVKFMVDASHSMSYKEGQVSKLQYARLIAAVLAYLARKQSDTFGLYLVNEKGVEAITPRFEQQQFLRFLAALVKIKAEGAWNTSPDLEHLFDHHSKEMIIFITDFYDHEGDLKQFIRRLKTTRNEVIVFHLMGRQEHELGFEGAFTSKTWSRASALKSIPLHSERNIGRRSMHGWKTPAFGCSKKGFTTGSFTCRMP